MTTSDPWSHRSADYSSSLVRLLIKRGHLGPDRPAALVHNMDLLKDRLTDLQSLFPAGTLHSLAVKSNPLLGLLRLAVEAGAGLEVASAGELALAQAAGCPSQKIVLDSPAKTRPELAQACLLGITINANSAAELARLESLQPRGRVGLRINPAVAQADRACATMVATPDSKFGVPLEQARTLLARYSWLSGLHVHVGSQVATLEDLLLAGQRVSELALEFPQVEWIDIGGGLPARYRSGDPTLSPAHYLQALRDSVPRLFQYQLITEFGRVVQANCGLAVSRVEYIETDRAVLHLGADFALRECYQPKSWPHEWEVFDSQGVPKEGPVQTIDLYGPLCFSGDRLAHQVSLPSIQPGDFVVMHDCGAYTLGMWSRYCSRPMPEVIGLIGEELVTLRRAEDPTDLVKFWS